MISERSIPPAATLVVHIYFVIRTEFALQYLKKCFYIEMDYRYASEFVSFYLVDFFKGSTKLQRLRRPSQKFAKSRKLPTSKFCLETFNERNKVTAWKQNKRKPNYFNSGILLTYYTMLTVLCTLYFII